MPDEIERKLLDKRVAHRYLKKGRLEEKDWDKHLKALPDLSEQAVPIEAALDFEDVDDDLDELPSPEATPATDTPKEG